ncbi:MAG: zinc permease [Chloroflexi bacterium]|nr:MAG: zinc permease [Chloroflexota bacterium]
MSHTTAALVGAIAGFSIFIGLPVARMRGLSKAFQGFLNAVATGVLLFLLWDILSHAVGPVQAALVGARLGSPELFIALALIFALGLASGLLVLIYFNARLFSHQQGAPSPRWLSLAIASGLGLHNLSEGLAIGQSAATGAVAFASVLVVGFALHNVTEGFGIAAPMAGADRPPSWAFLGLAGLIGGGPTLLGTLIGLFATSVYLQVLFLAVAAGALLWVINEMFHIGRRLNTPPALAWGLLTGFIVAFGTELLLTYLSL